MYGYTKRLTLYCGILTAFNILSTIMFFLFLANSELKFSLIFTAAIFLVTVSAFTLFMTIGIHRLCEILEMDYEDNIKRFHELSKKLAQLEEKCK